MFPSSLTRPPGVPVSDTPRQPFQTSIAETKESDMLSHSSLTRPLEVRGSHTGRLTQPTEPGTSDIRQPSLTRPPGVFRVKDGATSVSQAAGIRKISEALFATVSHTDAGGLMSDTVVQQSATESQHSSTTVELCTKSCTQRASFHPG